MTKGVIFDVGNTLIDFPATNSVEADEGISAVAKYLKLSAATFAHKLKPLLDSPKGDSNHRQINTYRDSVCKAATACGLELTVSQLDALELAFITPIVTGARPVAGMLEVLENLKGRCKLAVASNTRAHKLIFSALTRHEFTPFFDPIVTSMACGYRKPSARMFETVLAAWQLQPEHAAMVGDKLKNDVVGARALNIYTVWFSEGGSSELPDVTAKTARDVLVALEAWLDSRLS